MRHLHTGRKLGVDHSHRLAMLRSLALALIEQDSIRTTPARAKELRWWADRIITLAKRGDLASRRQIVELLGSTQTYKTGENRVRNALERVYSELAPRFKDRNGGYTQMYRLALRRPGDNAEMCLMRYLPGAEKTAKSSDKGGKAEAKSKKPASKSGTKAKKDAPAKKAKKATA